MPTEGSTRALLLIAVVIGPLAFVWFRRRSRRAARLSDDAVAIDVDAPRGGDS